MAKKLIFFVFFLGFVVLTAHGQLPKTAIWLFEVQYQAGGYKLNNPRKINVGNGYNNQPYFTRDGETLYFVSNGKKEGKTDIYKYTIKSKKIKHITHTKYESEYSPMLTPDGNRISCVRVDRDTVTQHLCTYNMKGKKPTILFPEQKTFGYYCWKNMVDLLAFHVPEPFTLKKHNIPFGKSQELQSHIGRCILNNRGSILYVDKTDTVNWTIRILNPKRIGTRKYDSIPPDQILTKCLEGAEDFALLRGKDLLMGKDGFIYRKQNIFRSSTSEWEAFLDLHPFGIYSFYRIVVSPIGNQLALVTYAGEKP